MNRGFRYTTAKRVASDYRIPLKQAKGIVDDTMRLIAETALKEGMVEVRGFGTFRIRERKARQTALIGGGTIVPAHRTLVFRPCPALLRRLA